MSRRLGGASGILLPLRRKGKERKGRRETVVEAGFSGLQVILSGVINKSCMNSESIFC
jgi:hypothetical protein